MKTVFLFCLGILLSCTAKKQVIPAFFYWKTTLEIKPAEQQYLKDIGCNKLYIKCLDIGVDPATGTIYPYSMLRVVDTAGLQDKTLVPAIFITNETFQHLGPEKTDWLATQTVTALRSVAAQFAAPDQLLAHEIVIDCDWTPRTREAFFSFLKKLRPLLPETTRLTATIRLHQYKQPEVTGLPPTDRGLLMLYNTGDIDRPDETNSIYQPAAAEKYLSGRRATYPLPLDIVLPVFSWGVVFRDEALWKIIPEFPVDAAADTQRFSMLSNGHLVVTTGTYIGGQYLREGDEVRIETVDSTLLREVADAALRVDRSAVTTIGFYHLDSVALRRYAPEFIKGVCRKFDIPR